MNEGQTDTTYQIYGVMLKGLDFAPEDFTGVNGTHSDDDEITFAAYGTDGYMLLAIHPNLNAPFRIAEIGSSHNATRLFSPVGTVQIGGLEYNVHRTNTQLFAFPESVVWEVKARTVASGRGIPSTPRQGGIPTYRYFGRYVRGAVGAGVAGDALLDSVLQSLVSHSRLHHDCL